jgi:hypothetical protein
MKNKLYKSATQLVIDRDKMTGSKKIKHKKEQA